MSLKNFRSYQLAVEFYREVSRLKFPSHLRDQMLRASSSICLNLAEGSAKATVKDRMRFYRIALGSLRECQAILDLLPEVELQTGTSIASLADRLGANIYGLTRI